MNDRTWVYLGQLTRALAYEGVEGGRAGEFVAEIESHLSETGVDPVDEFGPPPELAAEFARRPGSRRPEWVPPLWALWLLGPLLGMLLVVTMDAVAEGWDDAGIPIRAHSVVFAALLISMTLGLGYFATRRLDGRSWTLLTTPLVLASLALAAVTFTLAQQLEGNIIARVSPPVFWSLVGVAIPALLALIHRRHNPIRFPAHARHLNRLRRGPLAGRPPADPVPPGSPSAGGG